MTAKVEKKLPCCILLVDDEANVRTVFSDVLKRAGYQVKAVEAMRKGASDYLNKPFSPEELKLVIKKALEQKGNPPQPGE